MTKFTLDVPYSFVKTHPRKVLLRLIVYTVELMSFWDIIGKSLNMKKQDRFLGDVELIGIGEAARMRAVSFVSGLLPGSEEMLRLPATLRLAADEARNLVEMGFMGRKGSCLLANLTRGHALRESVREGEVGGLLMAGQLVSSSERGVIRFVDQLMANLDGTATVRLAHVLLDGSSVSWREDRGIVNAYARRAKARPSNQESDEFMSWWLGLGNGTELNEVNLVKLQAHFFKARLYDLASFAVNGADGYRLLYLRRRLLNGEYMPVKDDKDGK